MNEEERREAYKNNPAELREDCYREWWQTALELFPEQINDERVMRFCRYAFIDGWNAAVHFGKPRESR